MRQVWGKRRDSACHRSPRRPRGQGCGPQRGGPRTAEKTPEARDGGSLQAPQTILGASGFQNCRAQPRRSGGAPRPAAAFAVSEATAPAVRDH